MTAEEQREQALLGDSRIREYWEHQPRPTRLAQSVFNFSDTLDSIKSVCGPPSGDAGHHVSRGLWDFVAVCPDGCEYRVRKNVKMCHIGQKFVSLAHLFSPSQEQTGLKNISVGAFLTRDYETSFCQNSTSSESAKCCDQCISHNRLQLKHEQSGDCQYAVFTSLSEITVFSEIYEKHGSGDCCRIEPVMRRVVVSGDLHVLGGHSTIVAVEPLDICFLDDGDRKEESKK
jgi:hypothetical protein